jgi:hypothetical protein
MRPPSRPAMAMEKPEEYSTLEHIRAHRIISQHNTRQHSTAHHSTSYHNTAQQKEEYKIQHSTAQHSTAQHSTSHHSTAQRIISYHRTAHRVNKTSFTFIHTHSQSYTLIHSCTLPLCPQAVEGGNAHILEDDLPGGLHSPPAPHQNRYTKTVTPKPLHPSQHSV